MTETMAKTIIITGASRGIGREAATILAENGHRLIAVARTEQSLELLHQKYPDNIHPFVADLTEAERISDLVKFASETVGTIDILINNAGALVNKPFTELEMDDWQHMLDVNLLANVALTKALLPHFSNNAHIVNISSMGGFQGSAKFSGLSAYSVAKGAVSILSECLATELTDRSVSVNALCLGAVQTEMLKEAFPGFNAPVSAEQMGKYIAGFALEGSGFYNGKVLPVALNDPG